jgi:hypothetical protein
MSYRLPLTEGEAHQWCAEGVQNQDPSRFNRDTGMTEKK